MQRQLKWQEVLTKYNCNVNPKQRWGHRLLKANQQILLFGGFGGVAKGEGKYLNDLWKFDLTKTTWQPLETAGDYPEPRSNYTIHFNSVKNEVILFGGGSGNKVRYNSIFTLNMQTLQWKKTCPAENSDSPWERTYHTSEFLYPYLIVFGGQGASNLDLNDTWIFDVRTQEWSRIIPKGTAPNKRRFASSALIGTNFYLIGGCYGNYNLIGDICRLSLQPLLQGHRQQIEWECLITNNKLLQRWGHSADTYNEKIYIFAGRVSPNNDNSDFIQYDPLTGKIQKIQTTGGVPKPRRRHASTMIDNNLVVMGGYNGSYLNDFNYLKITKQTQKPSLILKKVKNSQILMKKIAKIEQQLSRFDFVIVKANQHIVKIPTNPKKLRKNRFFNNLIKNNHYPIYLPPFCSQQIFRIINVAITKGILLLKQPYDLQFYTKMAQALSYFSCLQQLNVFQKFLISLITQQNDFQLLELSIYSDFTNLNEVAATQFLKNRNLKSYSDQDSSSTLKQNQALLRKQKTRNVIMSNKQVKDSLKKAYHKYSFEIGQYHLSNSPQNILTKAKKLLAQMFSFNRGSFERNQTYRQEVQKQAFCSQAVISYFQGSWSF